MSGCARCGEECGEAVYCSWSCFEGDPDAEEHVAEARGEAVEPYDPVPDIEEAAGVSEGRARLIADHAAMFHNLRGYGEETLRSRLSALPFLDEGGVDAVMACPAVAGEGDA